MVIASLKDLYFDELGDLHDAETRSSARPAPGRAARAPELREVLKNTTTSRACISSGWS